jgi:ubiquinone/menaquinone biosynthesis C-methylase UbiE
MHAIGANAVSKKCKPKYAGFFPQKKSDALAGMGILATMQRKFSADEPEIMDLPGQDEEELRADLQNLAQLNRTFGGRVAVEKMFRHLAHGKKKVLLADLASGYGDQGRNLIERGREQNCDVTVVAVDFQFQTLKLARAATPREEKMFFVQADARNLPFRNRGADLVFCSLALHHFAETDAVSVLREMARVGRLGTACVDLVRGRLAVFCIWLLTAVVMRDPMTRHDARLSVRRAFTHEELRSLTERAGWRGLVQTKFFWFQQAVLSRLCA